MRNWLIPGMLLLALSARGAERIVGYYPSWIRTTLPAAKIRFQDITTIAHAFIWPRSDGSLDMYSDLVYPEMISKAHTAGVKVVISIGGWGQCDGFAPMAATAATRKIFIDNVIAFMKQQGYDGIDLDWEYPTGSAQRNTFTQLVREFRQAFDAAHPAWTISFVVPSGQYSGTTFDYAAVLDAVTWIGCMTYDFHGAWTNHAGHNAPLYAPGGEAEGSIDDSVLYLKRLGIPASQLLVGVPFYGRRFSASRLYGPATGGDEITYAKLIPQIKPDWNYVWDNTAKVPYYQDAAKTIFITFDDTASVRYKCEYVRNNKLGGLIIWALGQDYLGTQQPLLQTIGDRLKRNTAAVEQPEIAQPENVSLLRFYPNPCNSTTRMQFFSERAGEAHLQLFDLLGREVMGGEKIRLNGGWQEIPLSGEGLATGIYLVRLAGPQGILTGKITFIR